MPDTETNNWQWVQETVRKRIQDRVWKPGELIPNEADLAVEFGCARTTVNRALRQLAEAGLLDRKRKAGTRVALHPVRKATLQIPIIRKEVEERNQVYDYTLISARKAVLPSDVCARMKLEAGQQALKVEALHLADGKPYLYEDRWVNLGAVPEIGKADLGKISANEWLVMNAPFTHGDIAFSAINASREIARILHTSEKAALFMIERTTWNDDIAMTDARMIYSEGYRLRTAL